MHTAASWGYNLVGATTLVHPIFFGVNLAWNAFNRGCPPRSDAQLQGQVQQLAGDWLNNQGLQPTVVEGATLLAQGIRVLPTSKLIVRMPEHLRSLDEPVYTYLLKYQVSKLKYNDITYTHSVCILLTTPGSLLLTTGNHVYNNLGLLASVVGTAATHAFRYYVEYRTEEFAIDNATDEELKGALCFYFAFQEQEQEQNALRNSFTKIVNFNGGIYNLASPSISNRIQRITNALSRKDIQVHGETFGEKAPLLAPPNKQIFDLDSVDVQERIAKLKGLCKVLIRETG